MKLNKPILTRLLIVAVPLLGLYGFAQMAFRANRLKEHPTDAGLGIAFLLVFILLILFFGFVVDVILRIKRKQRSLALIDAVFLLLFMIPVLYIGCLIASRDCLCKWLIDAVDFVV